MDKFSYAIGLGIGQNLLSMGAKGIAVDDFAQAIKDVLEGNQTAISHQEAREIVNTSSLFSTVISPYNSSAKVVVPSVGMLILIT